MFLIKLTKLTETETGIAERDWYVNAQQIATMMQNSKGTSVAVRGFTANTIVKQTPEEIIDAIQQSVSDNSASFWAENIASMEYALGDVGLLRKLAQRILHPAVISGSGGL